MTVPATTRKAGPFTGTGSQTVFPFSFKIFAVTDVKLVQADANGIETTLNSGYTVTMNSDQVATPGGSVTLSTALASGYKLSIIGNLPYDQTLAIPGGGNYNPVAHENALDRIVEQMQQISEVAGRQLVLPVTAAIANTTLPSPASNKLISWNASADGLQNIDPVSLATVVAFGTANADVFTGTGAQTAFTLSANPGAQANLDVSVGGVTQTPGLDYTWSGGTTVTFTAAPPNGARVLLRYFQGLPQGTTDSAASTYTPDGGGSAVSTTVQTQMRRSKTVSGFTSVQAAFDYCIANNYDLEIDQLVTLTSSINIDRLVDGAAFDNYFRVFSKNGGGFKVTTAMAMFTTSIAFTTDPVSQLVFFDGVTFIGNSGASYVLNGGRFLRTRFDKCNFDKVLCCNSTIYTQSIYITNCNIRRIVGTFWTSTAQCYDFKFIGNIVEAVTGNVLSLAKAIGCAVMGNLLEGVTGTAITYNGSSGLTISGNYFESNGIDIDGTGATQANGVLISGNYFSHTAGASNPATYSVIWGNGSPTGCASIGNYHTARMHNFPVAGMDVFVKDSATTSLYNNEPNPLFNTTLMLNDGALGPTYGGVIKGYGIGGRGPLLGLGTLSAGVYNEGITIDENMNTTLKGSAFISGATTSAPAGQLNIGKTTATTVGAAGAASALPAAPATYLQINISGTFYKIPVYNN